MAARVLWNQRTFALLVLVAFWATLVASAARRAQHSAEHGAELEAEAGLGRQRREQVVQALRPHRVQIVGQDRGLSPAQREPRGHELEHAALDEVADELDGEARVAGRSRGHQLGEAGLEAEQFLDEAALIGRGQGRQREGHDPRHGAQRVDGGGGGGALGQRFVADGADDHEPVSARGRRASWQ